MIVGFTGTCKGMTVEQKDELASHFLYGATDEFHHGGCRGADEEAHDLLYKTVSHFIVHPGLISMLDMPPSAPPPGYVIILPRKRYLERNHDIVDCCAILIACPSSKVEQLRSGTWATMRYAKKIGRRMIVIWPDGSTGNDW